jgi:hypothetical protein
MEAEKAAIEFGIGVGEYDGVVRIPNVSFNACLTNRRRRNVCLEAYICTALGSNASLNGRSVAGS